jgi:hypothetical protein
MTSLRLFAALSLTLILGACAEMHALTSSTPAPAKQAAPPPASGSKAGIEAYAATLDAKQRLFLTNALGVICAEPSLDPHAALALSVNGAGGVDKAMAAAPSGPRDAAFGAAPRAQWSALMRDEMYRICEAYHNKAISGPQVAQLLFKTQDLTLATAAVEHLTDAVAGRAPHATPPIGSGDAAPSAGLTQLRGLVEVVQREEQRRNAALEAATQAVDKGKANLEQKQAAVSNADKRTSAEEKQQLLAAVVQAQVELAAAEQSVKDVQGQIEEAKKTRQAIEKGIEMAATEQKAGAPVARVLAPLAPAPLDANSIAQVAISVKEIVAAVVNKSYLAEGCFAVLTADRPVNPSVEETKARDEQFKFCMSVVQSSTPPR